jgi:hypothetical protein
MLELSGGPCVETDSNSSTTRGVHLNLPGRGRLWRRRQFDHRTHGRHTWHEYPQCYRNGYGWYQRSHFGAGSNYRHLRQASLP